MKRWVIRAKRADFAAVAQKHNISQICARLLRNRDLITDEEINMYLNGRICDMHNPFLLKDMDMTCKLIINAANEGKHIRIVGDYDIDGVCATTILLRGIRRIGANVSARLPHRVRDGYGLNVSIIDEAKADGVDMIVTCDNGIAAMDEIKHAKDLGIDVIVTDHHEIPFDEENNEKIYKMPKALAVVNPHRADDDYPYKNICGAMVAYKVILALQKCLDDKNTRNKIGISEDMIPCLHNIPGELTDMLFDFAAFATVGDIMPLCDENRIAVKYGLHSLRNTKNIGMSALIDATEVKRNKLSTYHIGFILGPCINAVGRLGSADSALELFMTDEVDRAVELANYLKQTNEKRKAIENQKLDEAFNIVETGSDGHDYSSDTVILLLLEDCHESLAGLIAGKLKEKYSKPALVFTKTENGLKGSGRSIESYDMFENLSKYKDMYLKFGGHPMACGLSIAEEQFENIRRILNDNSPLTEENLIEKYYIDIDMPINYVDMNLVSELDRLAPFGQSNPSPLFAQKNLMIVSRKKNPKGNMITLQVKSPPHMDKPECTMFAIMFGNADELLGRLEGKNTITMAYVPEYNDYYERVQLTIKDFL